MITAQNITKFFIGLILCYMQLAYSQQPAMHSTSTATATGAAVPPKENTEKALIESSRSDFKYSVHLARTVQSGNIASLAAYVKLAKDASKTSTFILCNAINFKNIQHRHVTLWLLDNGAKPPAKVLTQAVNNKDLETSRLLLERETPIEVSLLTQVTLSFTGEPLNLSMMKLLLFYKANPNEQEHYIDSLRPKVTPLEGLITRLATVDYSPQNVDEVIEKAKLLVGYNANTDHCLKVLDETEHLVSVQLSDLKEDSIPNAVDQYRDRLLVQPGFDSRVLWEQCRHGDKLVAFPENPYFNWLRSFNTKCLLIEESDTISSHYLDLSNSRRAFPYFLVDMTKYLEKKIEAIKIIRTYIKEFPQINLQEIGEMLTLHLSKDPAGITKEYLGIYPRS